MNKLRGKNGWPPKIVYLTPQIHAWAVMLIPQLPSVISSAASNDTAGEGDIYSKNIKVHLFDFSN